MGSRYAGIDWASDKHDVLVADETGAEVVAATFARDEKGLTALCRTLVRLEVGVVAIKRPDGLLVERLLDAGLRVWRCTRTRSRRLVTASGSRAGSPIGLTRSCCASSRVPIITAPGARARFRSHEGDPGADPSTGGSRGRSHRDRQPAPRGARAVLAGPLTLFSHMDAEILLAFLERYPSPADAHGLGVARMQAFLTCERYSGGQHPTALMAKLRSAPRARIGELELAARRRLVLSFVAMVRTLNAQIKDLVLWRAVRGDVRLRPQVAVSQRPRACDAGGEMNVRGLFETHLTVADLSRSVAFYRDVVGLPVALEVPERGAAFHWVGPAGHAMLGLWSLGSAPVGMQLHIAFEMTLPDVLAAPDRLLAQGIQPLSFFGEPAHEPSVIGWMPAAAVYFRDPDGHLLEYLAMLEGTPRPGLGIVPWSQRGE